MNQKIVAVFLLVCFVGSALSQDALWNMMFLRQLMGQNKPDAAMAQNTNAVPGADPAQQGGAGLAGGMNSLFPMMYGANAMDIDPLMMMMFVR